MKAIADAEIWELLTEARAGKAAASARLARGTTVFGDGKASDLPAEIRPLRTHWAYSMGAIRARYGGLIAVLERECQRRGITAEAPPQAKAPRATRRKRNNTPPADGDDPSPAAGGDGSGSRRGQRAPR